MDLPQHWPLADTAEGTALREELLAAYADPTRHYHDTRHLAEVLTHLRELDGSEPLPVVLAAWFHDAIYDGERDAEERSAAWAEDALPDLVGEEVAAEVARLVRLTETHDPEPDDIAGCALSDADMAILASGPERYADYAAGVRQEFAHVPDEDFRAGRAQVLRSLLERETIYHTAYARDRWEDTARANLERELGSLEQAGSTTRR